MLNQKWSTPIAERELAEAKHKLTAKMPKILLCSPHPPKIKPLEDVKARVKRELRVHKEVNCYLASLGFEQSACANSATIFRRDKLVVWFRYIECWDRVIVEVSHYNNHRRLTASEFRLACAKIAKEKE